MAIPEERLSTTPQPSGWLGAAALPTGRNFAYRDGPLELQNPIMGIDNQLWTCRVEDNERVYLSAENVEEYELFTGTGITDIDIAFDRNANLYYTWTAEGVTYLRWYDAVTGQMTTTNFGSDLAPSPCLDLDDKRDRQSARADVLLVYVKKTDGKLYYRQQRDRFAVEKELPYAKPLIGIERIGMGTGEAPRMQFQVVEW